jgi:hypothetical protein
MKRRTVVRIAAVAVATATVVTGLVDVSAAAGTTASGGSEVSVSGRTPVVVASESDRLVGPLAMIQNDTTAFGLRADADTMRTTAAGTIAEAQSLADDWSVPAVGQTGPVRGVGAKADRCMTKRSPGNASLDTEPCTGSPQQDWTWTDTTSRQGFTKALSPVTAPHRAIAPEAPARSSTSSTPPGRSGRWCSTTR